MISNVGRTGWFTATNPAKDYQLLKKIAARSVFGSRDKIDTLDLAGLEGDFRSGQYEYQDYYIGLIDGRSRSDRISNALNDLNGYFKLLRNYKRKHGNFDGLAAVRLHQTNYRIDGARYETRLAPLITV